MKEKKSDHQKQDWQNEPGSLPIAGSYLYLNPNALLKRPMLPGDQTPTLKTVAFALTLNSVWVVDQTPS